MLLQIKQQCTVQNKGMAKHVHRCGVVVAHGQKIDVARTKCGGTLRVAVPNVAGRGVALRARDYCGLWRPGGLRPSRLFVPQGKAVTLVTLSK
jgi:hypothetical protein